MPERDAYTERGFEVARRLGGEVRSSLRRINVPTVVNEDATLDAKAKIEYNLPVVVETRNGTRAGLDYSNVQRIVQFPPGGRWPRKVAA